MSDVEMGSDSSCDSEKELENLRTFRHAIECDDIAFSAPQSASSSTTYIQVSDPYLSTEYSKIEKALALNKHSDEKIQRLEKILEQRLLECRDKLKKVRGQKLSDVERCESFRYINCGRPYFKDKDNFAAPDNSDTLLMAKNDMYDFSTITSVPGWTMRDKTQLWNKIEKMSKIKQKKELQSQIAALKRDLKNNSDKAHIRMKINDMKKQMNKVNKMSLQKLALPIDQDYDWEEITHSLDRRHCAAEYQALWKLYLHPSINKSNWSKAEHQKLQTVAHENDLHGWEKIAKIMGNNRTAYQCFVYFRTNMNNTFTGKKWSDEEVDYLLRLTDYFKEDNYIPWVKIAALMENRTKIQIYNKYLRLLEQRKGRFLPEEDAVILTCADDFGPDYKKMAQFLPVRSLTQIRVRYQALNKKRVSTVWTVEEDRKLLQLLTNQDTAANFASVTKYFPGKDRINIRARYVTLVRWMRRNPNADIVKAPRRGARRLGHGTASENLNDAVENLKTRIQTETVKKRTNRVNIDCSEEDIEDGIIAALTNEYMFREDIAMNDSLGAEQAPILRNDTDINYDKINEGNLQKLLIILRAKLNKEKFESCHANSRKPNLDKTDSGTCIVKVKSYSKKNKIKSIELNSAPDVWGNNTFKSSEYILPPNYATITGCRKLMTFIAAKLRMDDTSANFSLMGRRNVVLREQLDILMERINILFMWPLLLSNEGPNLATVYQVDGLATTDNNSERCIDQESDVDVYENKTSDRNNRVDVNSDSDDASTNTNQVKINIKNNKYTISVKQRY